MQYDSEEFAQN